MSDASDQPGVSSAPTESAAPATPGQWLKQERERQGSTVQRIAADMHLSVAVIEAIEQNKFSKLGAPVFAKGHLRKYASLLGLPVERVFELYDRLDDAPRQVDPVPNSQRAPEPALRPSIRDVTGTASESNTRSGSFWPVVGAILGLVIVGAIAWWVFTRSGQHVAAAEPLSEKALAIETQPIETRAPKQKDSIPQASGQPTQASAQTVVAPVGRSAVPMGMAPPGKVRIRLTFARDSWVEVYDATGNRMLYDVGRTEIPRTIDAEPPAVVVLGDAEAVATEANGKLLNVPRKNILGSVARFSIAADGTIR